MITRFRNRLVHCLVAATAFLLPPGLANVQAQRNSVATTNLVRIVEMQGEVQISPAGARRWVLTQTNEVLQPFDRVRTGPNSRVALRWSDSSVVPFGPLTELEILPPHNAKAQSGLHLIRGVISFFHRDKPGRIRVITRGAVAGVEGTEFVVRVDNSDRTTLSVVDGRVSFGNDNGTLVLTNGQQAVVDPGTAPVRTTGFVANNLLQWSFYYPAVLDLNDLTFSEEERRVLAESLDAYRAGDLPSALETYPGGRSPGSEAERLYHAALLLSVGQVEAAQSHFVGIEAAGSERHRRIAAALLELIAAVKRQSVTSRFEPELPTEFLARSYYEQSRAVAGESLELALALARKAHERSPQFSFAAARVGELEFSSGNRDRAESAVEASLQNSPRNAQALALKGFLAAARNHSGGAIDWFNRALAVDSSLANAWLGRGLCRIRRGDTQGGRDDLLIAAALEPQRSELRSYLGKSYGDAGEYDLAVHELDLAKELDSSDPTPWLYSALIHYGHNQINQAVRDLEKSQTLNDNRSVYRSQLLLDQDRAVRSANLARIYEDAGMVDVSVREAGRAVSFDYANYSAHAFLGGSLNPGVNLISRRYETASRQEFLLANLLAPASAGTLSPMLSHAEYSRLFERNRFGLVADSQYLSRGAWTTGGAQYGIFERVSYDLDWLYAWDRGQRVNNFHEVRNLGAQIKAQITPEDSVFLKVTTLEASSGDLAQRYDPDLAFRNVRIIERQEPMLHLGYHREWAPGVHTLFLGSRLHDTVSVTNPFAGVTSVLRPVPDFVPGAAVHTIGERSWHGLEIYSAELQQIWQRTRHTTILGGRVQYGSFDTELVQANPQFPVGVFYQSLFPGTGQPAAVQDLDWTFKRFSGYGYHQWQVHHSLQLIGGLTYDWMQLPENFWFGPVATNSHSIDQVSPKGGIIWTPLKDTVVRAAYTRALGGAASEGSHQIEPSHVAGFVQSYRSIIPESAAGLQPGANFETYAVSLEQKFSTGTYLAVSGELLYSDLTRTVGSYDLATEFDIFAVAAGLRQKLDYREHALTVSANQLVGDRWSFGGRYRVSQAVLKGEFPDMPEEAPFYNNFLQQSRQESVLHSLSLYGVFNHPCGFFARSEANWFAQSDEASAASEPGDDFWQFNAFAGYRFPRRRAEVSVGVLNIGDQDYRLRPLNLHPELARERTLFVRLKVDF